MGPEPLRKTERPVKTFEEALKKYGNIINGKWADEYKHMVIYETPEWFQNQVIGLDGKPCKRIYMNKDMVAAFENALDLLVLKGVAHELKSFEGCFNIRLVRGSSTAQSAHSFGLALDFNAPTNRLGTEGEFSEEFGKCFELAGFTWGKRFSRKDPMHFEYAWN